MEADNKKNVELLANVVNAAYFAMVEALACIEVLQAGNQESVVKGINGREALITHDLITKALFTRVLLATMVFFDPHKEKGDFHLRVGIDLLRKGHVTAKDDAKAEEVVAKFATLEKSDVFKKLRQHRNKEVSHISERDPAIDRAAIGELLGFAKDCRDMVSLFLEASGIIMPSIDSQVQPYTEHAKKYFEAFQ